MGPKVAVITGATSGIGLEVARALAGAGFAVIGIGRSRERCAAARDSILASAPGAEIRYMSADLFHQREVRRVAGEIRTLLEEEYEGKLAVLVNNTGCAQSYYTTTEEGFERQFALNYLSAFLLTHLLLPCLLRAGGRVLLTGSKSHKGARVRWNDVMLTRGYAPLTAYKQSKLCCLLLAKGLNDRYGARGLRAFAVDPGLVKTDIGTKAGSIVKLVWRFRKPFGVQPGVPAQTYLWLCRQETPPEALYYYQCRPRRYSRQVTGENADRLFRLSHRLCGTEEWEE